MPICGVAASLVSEERERRRLVQEPGFAVRLVGVGWIAEDPAVDQVAVEVGDR